MSRVVKMRRMGLITLMAVLISAQPAFAISFEFCNKVSFLKGICGTEDQDDAAGREKEARSFSEAEMKVLTALSKREAALKKKEALHQQRAAELKTLSQQIEQKLDQIRKLTADFETKRQKRKEMDEKDVTRMVGYYEKMDPERTAVFFNQMDRITAAHILKRMNPRKASTVMELLEPKVAVEITEMLTQFKADRKSLVGN